MIKLTGPETYTATIGGTEWSNITPASHMWAEVQAMIEVGAEVLDLTLPPSPTVNDAWAALRAERNALLPACDWTQVADAPVDAAAWAVYRQALRDLPQNTTDPFNPIWPTPPEA